VTVISTLAPAEPWQVAVTEKAAGELSLGRLPTMISSTAAPLLSVRPWSDDKRASTVPYALLLGGMAKSSG